MGRDHRPLEVLWEAQKRLEPQFRAFTPWINGNHVQSSDESPQSPNVTGCVVGNGDVTPKCATLPVTSRNHAMSVKSATSVW